MRYDMVGVLERQLLYLGITVPCSCHVPILGQHGQAYL